MSAVQLAIERADADGVPPINPERAVDDLIAQPLQAVRTKQAG